MTSRPGISLWMIGALSLVVTGACAAGSDGAAPDAAAPHATTTISGPTHSQRGVSDVLRDLAVLGYDTERKATGTLLGASISPESRGLAAEQAAVEALEQAIGRPLDINHDFYGWEDPFPTEIERWDLQGGRTPMISWNGKGVTTAAIAAGHYDGLTDQRARAVRDLGGPVLIRWFWEMDGNKKADFARVPEEHVAAWRRIVTMFRDRGADNVRWVWCPNASAFNDGTAQRFYPGDDVVDWMCADGYNWAPGRPDDEYRSFKESSEASTPGRRCTTSRS